jgi:predicted dehydrogenase
MADRVFRWGLLSTAAINRALIPALRASSNTVPVRGNVLAGVASRDPGRADAYAREWKIPKAYGSYEAMLADPEIDAVYISLPNSLHAPWTIAAANAGKHVLCEKPLAISVEEVDAMADAGRKAGVVIAEAFMYRHHPQTLKVKELLDEGAIGALRQIRGAFSFHLDRPGDVRLIPELGGGSIWDVGCYPISYARAMTGSEPLEAFGWQLPGETGVDVGFTGQLRFPDDVFFQFDCGFRHAGRQTMEFVGESGWLRVEEPFTPREAPTITVTDSGGKQRVIRSPRPELYLGEVEDLYEAALHGVTPRVTLADSRANVAAILALLRSAASGRPESVSSPSS